MFLTIAYRISAFLLAHRSLYVTGYVVLFSIVFLFGFLQFSLIFCLSQEIDIGVLFVCSAKHRSQSLMNVRQVLYHWVRSPTLKEKFCFFFLACWGLNLGLLQTFLSILDFYQGIKIKDDSENWDHNHHHFCYRYSWVSC